MGRKSIADIRRQEFASAAFEVLSEHGLQGTTLQRVADHTGASKASVLHYFSSKQVLIETALRQANAALRREAVTYMNLAATPWERFYGIVEANFSPTTFRPAVANGWIAMCAEVPHNESFRRIQTVIFRRLDSNLRSALCDIEPTEEGAADTANTVSLLIDGLWLRCGLKIGGLERDQAKAEIERVLRQRFGETPERTAARKRMESLAEALTAAGRA